MTESFFATRQSIYIGKCAFNQRINLKNDGNFKKIEGGDEADPNPSNASPLVVKGFHESTSLSIY